MSEIWSCESEQAVLGAVMMEPGAIDKIDAPLLPKHFFDPRHATIWDLVSGLVADGKPADPVSVLDAASEKGSQGRVGGFPYLNELAMAGYSSSSVSRHAAIVRERAMRRGLVDVAQSLESLSRDPKGKSTAEIIDAVQTMLGSLADDAAVKAPVSVQESLCRVIDVLSARLDGQDPEPAIETGLVDLDRMLNGGLRRGRVYVVGARPGMGKSAFAQTVANNAAQAGHSVLQLSMEMPESEVSTRAAANWGRIGMDELMHLSPQTPQQKQDELMARLTSTMRIAQAVKLHIDDTPGLMLSDIAHKARAIKRKVGLDLLVVDYLQLMTGDDRESRNTQLERITKGLKGLSKTLDVAVVLLSQLSRKVDERTDRRPILSDLRDSGAVEQDADAVLMLYRPEADNPDHPAKGLASCFVRKHRQGKIGEVTLAFMGAFSRFDNAAERIDEIERQHAEQKRADKAQSKQIRGRPF